MQYHILHFKELEEQKLVNGLLECAKWGFPLQRRDIQSIVQCYLNNRGVKTKFNDNRPGMMWFINFMKRNKELTSKFAENIKRVRALVTKNTIAEYFDNLRTTLEGVEPSNVVNYDETNFSDNPGATKIICKRGVRHADRIMDTSKTSISVMVAAAADGTVLPPYTLYKAKHIYAGWTEGGIEGAEYNRNASGWFDAEMFEDWFHKIMLPYFRRLNGPKVMLGVNSEKNVKAGFRACGIFPFDPQKVISKITDHHDVSADQEKCWSDSFVDVLKEFRKEDTTKPKRGKKIKIAAGKDLRNTDEIHADEANEDVNLTEEENEEDDRVPTIDENDYEIGEPSTASSNTIDDNKENYELGDHVLVQFSTNKSVRFFVGKIDEIQADDTFIIRFLRKRHSKKEDYFVYPEQEDVRVVDSEMIIKKVIARQIRRQRYIISSIDKNVE
ncbi:hypothetical protein NQ315_017492 [Exocentrus adspersus]|uniref:DDE-1 domain-containing protein n=1 Tax=Exocentrus adspersus TaxID=1586481 RepID=A0AAV8VJJ1_9CUCU|nr:hypothetical protein NQ315_017492 [Exocentrus adspersus]